MKRLFQICCVLALPWLGAHSASSADEENLVTAVEAFRTVTLTGFTRARAALPLVAETSGKVLEVSADIGDPIDQSGVFALLDPTFIGLDLEANRVQQKQLRSRVDYDARETKRYRALVSKGSASESRLDELEQTLRDNRHRLAELAVQEKVLEERLARTRVTAPAGWRIIRRSVEPGQRVNEGDVLGQVADFSTLLVPFALTPQQFTGLRKQADALEVGLPDRRQRVPARIYRVNPDFDPSTRKISVDIALNGELEDQRGGVRVALDLGLPERGGAVLLPEAAVEESYEEHWVTRESGERVRVVRLGNHAGPNGIQLRVSAPNVKPGDRFRLNRGE